MKKSKEKIKSQSKEKEKYLKNIFEQFLVDARAKFSTFDLTNMDKNGKTIHFDVETKIETPARYLSDYNAVILGEKLDDRYTENERKHAVYHELVHMASTKNSKILNSKTGFGFIYPPFIAKRIAITEGLTEYITEEITGNEIDISYVFEKRCAKSLCMIFGDDIIQDFFNADEKNLYKDIGKYGISKKEMKELFAEMDKSLMWRNNSALKIRKGKQIEEKNKYICSIEQELVNMAVRVSMEKGESKEDILEKIDRLTQNFIKPNLKFNIGDKKEENFLSEYSEDIDKPFEYATKMKEEILGGNIKYTTELISDKEKNESTYYEKDKTEFIAQLENLKNTNTIDIKKVNKEKQKQIEQYEKTI